MRKWLILSVLLIPFSWAAAQKANIVILDSLNKTGSTKYKYLSASISTYLHKSMRKTFIYKRSNVKKNQRLANTMFSDSITLEKLKAFADSTNSNYVIFGHYQKSGDNLIGVYTKVYWRKQNAIIGQASSEIETNDKLWSHLKKIPAKLVISILKYLGTKKKQGHSLRTRDKNLPALYGTLAWFERLGKKFTLAQIKEFEFLDFHSIDIENDDLIHLHSLKKLKRLTLWTGITDDGLKHLQGIKQLRTLNLASTRISNEGLRILKKVKKLQRLDLTMTSISDSGLKNLALLRNLQEVDLTSTKVTSAGFVHLVKLKNLSSLNLQRIHVTDVGLDQIRKLKSLTTLNLKATRIDDHAMGFLGKMYSLRRLDVSLNSISDRGLEHISRLDDMRYLNLAGTQISDKGLGYFFLMKRLTELNLSATEVTVSGLLDMIVPLTLKTLKLTSIEINEEEMAALKKKLPYTEIIQ